MLRFVSAKWKTLAFKYVAMRKDVVEGISLSSATRAHRTCRPGGPAGGRPGFNEDRRICPIKTSYKDPSGSTLIRKTSNLDFAAAASSYPRAI